MTPPFRPLCVSTQSAFYFAIFASLCLSSPSGSLDLLDPLLGGNTIGDFILANPTQNFTPEFVAPTRNCTGLTDNVDVSNLDASAWSCASSPILEPRGRRLPSRIPLFRTYSYSATHDDGNGNGYNITLPTQLCRSNVIGDFRSPDGLVIPNATMQTVFTSLTLLSADELYDYTVNMLQNASDRLYAALEALICDPPTGGARGLLTRYLASQVSGFWVIGFLATIGTLAIGYGGLYIPISHPGPTANWTGAEDTAMIAATTALGFVYTYALVEMRKKEITNVVEAAILTFLSTSGEYLVLGLQKAWEQTCTTTLILLAETGEFCLRIREGLTVVGDGDNLPANVHVLPQNDPQQGAQPQQQQVQIANLCPNPNPNPNPT